MMATVSRTPANPQLLSIVATRRIRSSGREASQDEVIRDRELLGVYNWGANFVRVYKEKAVLSLEQDPARYRERVLTKTSLIT